MARHRHPLRENRSLLPRHPLPRSNNGLAESHQALTGLSEVIKLRGHDEVVLVQALDLLGPQRDRRVAPAEAEAEAEAEADVGVVALRLGQFGGARHRSEERRVGKECRSRWSRYH